MNQQPRTGKSPQVQTLSSGVLKPTDFRVTRDRATVTFHAGKTAIPLTWQKATKFAKLLRMHGRRESRRDGMVCIRAGNVKIDMLPDVALWAAPIMAEEARAARKFAGAPATILATGILSDAEDNYKRGIS